MIDRNNFIYSLDPPERLSSLLATVAYGEPLDMVTAEWLAVGILRMIREGGRLDHHLGLHAPTGRLARFDAQLWTHKRALHLLDAMNSTAIDENVDPWEKAKRLEGEINRFQRTWSITRHAAQPDPHWPPVRRHLWLAASTGQELPTTAQGLYRAIAKRGLFSERQNGLKMLVNFLPIRRPDADTEDYRGY